MKFFQSTLIVALSSLLAYLVVEGGYALSRGDRPDWSMGYQLYDRLVSRFRPVDGVGVPPGNVILQERQFRELMGDFLHDGVALGNSPYQQLRNEVVAFNYLDEGCLRQKPNLDKTMVYLRTTLFEPFGPPNAQFDTDRELSPGVQKFIETYGIRSVRHRSNRYGERLTEPSVSRNDKVLVSGDSVAAGVGVMDRETIASNLQRMDPDLQYINTAVGGAEARDILCNLEKAAERYAGQIKKLVYVYCENDLKEDEPFGQPEDVIAWLSRFAQTQKIGEVTIVYAPYIYNVFSDVTRIKGDSKGWRYSYFSDEKRRLHSLVSRAGFKWIDIGVLANQKVEQDGSMFAGLSLYVDRVHLSPLGNTLVAQHIFSDWNGRP